MATDLKALHAGTLSEREEVLARLRAREGELRAIGVTRLRLFGSMARGEAGPDSDIDLIAEIDHSSGFSLLDLAGLQLDLAELLGRKVQIGTAIEKARPRIRRRIEADAIEVF